MLLDVLWRMTCALRTRAISMRLRVDSAAKYSALSDAAPATVRLCKFILFSYAVQMLMCGLALCIFEFH